MVLNVIGVRLNPKTGAVSESDKKWQMIPAPQGISGTIKSGQGRTELQVDLASTQNLAQVLNSATIPAQTYSHIELVLDPQNPGNFVPLCGQAQPRGEGCIVYPAKLLNPNVSIQVQGAVSFAVSKNSTTPLVLSIDPGIAGAPANSADSVSIDPVITVVPNQSFAGGTGNPQMALVTGTVKNASRKETISAELTGTAQIVASVATQKGGVYALNLPAAATGTTYDLVASGTGKAFAVKSGLTVLPGQESSGINFNPASHGATQVTGKVLDACTSVGIQGASLELLLPDASIDPTPDCTANTPTGCVIVATAQSSRGGKYPVPSTSIFFVPPFLQIPTGTNYTIRITNSGYNLGNIAVNTVAGALKCPDSGFKNGVCSINLEHGEIDATVDLGATNTGPSLNALIVAEESGTNNLLSVATAVIPTGASQSAPVPVFVPDNSASTNPMASLDFFASVQDSFGTPTNGSPQKATGHSIAVAAPVAGSAKCPLQNNLTPTPITISGASCVGHGSVEGTVGSPDNNTVVVLASNGVQLMQTGVPTGTVSPGEFSFCAPADQTANYTLQHYERQSDGSLSLAASIPVVLAAPITTPAPCSGICGNTANTCLLCTGVNNVNLP